MLGLGSRFFESMEADGESELYPRDLLRRFADSGSLVEKKPLMSSDEIDLSLELSLNGSFGVDPKRSKLVRSSSVALIPMDQEFSHESLSLVRTCSLPTETEEQHRKRKELQSLKRMEAKRKRSEKRGLRGLPPPRKTEVEVGGGSVGFMGFGRGASSNGGGGGGGGEQTFGVPMWAAAGVVSQGSIGSQGSSSSGVSELESRPLQGVDVLEAKSPAMVQPLSEHIGHKPTSPSSTTVAARGGEHPLRRNTSGDVERNMLEEMPCVSTTGEGPNGRRIEGFLYKYRKGEEVRIVCVCHGSFLTPAEFVRHAGGGEVAHPLRHIVVSASPSPLL